MSPFFATIPLLYFSLSNLNRCQNVDVGKNFKKCCVVDCPPRKDFIKFNNFLH